MASDQGILDEGKHPKSIIIYVIIFKLLELKWETSGPLALANDCPNIIEIRDFKDIKTDFHDECFKECS